MCTEDYSFGEPYFRAKEFGFYVISSGEPWRVFEQGVT